MKFSAVTDVDLRRSTRRRNTPDIPLEEELSAEELIAFYERLELIDQHKAQRTRSNEFFKQQQAYAEEIATRVEKRKAEVDRKACFKLNIPTLATRAKMLEEAEKGEGKEWEDPESFENAWNSFQVTQVGAICSDQRQLGAWLGADPHKIRWNTLVKSLFTYRDGKRYTSPALCALVAECRASAFPEVVWNRRIAEMEPSTKGGIQYGIPSVYDDPTRPQHGCSGMKFLVKGPDTGPEVLKWMMQAEQHQLEDRVTQCQFSGQTLVESGIRGGKSFWRIAPNWQGMSLGMARLAVTYAAIVAGIAEGVLSGKPPKVVYQLANDGDAWCALAVATKHPEFYDIARAMVMLRDRLYFDLDEADMRANMRVAERIAARAAKEEIHE